MAIEEKGKGWRGISEEIIVGMTEWRQQNPKATFRAIEEELDRRLAELRVRMLADIAVTSASADWESGGKGPICPNCGAELEANGKKSRKLQTRGGQEVELEREYGICSKCGQGIFPPG
jgi:YgiT-type zinc finger domain-containing protein